MCLSGNESNIFKRLGLYSLLTDHVTMYVTTRKIELLRHTTKLMLLKPFR